MQSGLEPLPQLLSASERSRWRRLAMPVLAPLLVFAAVASRADAILCLPLFCWASFRGCNWRRFRTRASFWLMAIAAAFALGLGRWLAEEATTSFYGAFFEPRVLAAYLAFRLGGCGLWALQVLMVTPV